MARTHDRLIHQYFGVNLDIVWGIIELELPGVVAKLTEIINQGEGSWYPNTARRFFNPITLL
jgi:uncharacterized protein with HEPN domain